MKIAIMQPYVFPFIGYFQLINAVDIFVFYDDVNFIKRGWINRNRILVKNEASLFSIPLKKISQNKLINEIEIDMNEKWIKRFLKTITQNYKEAPNYDKTFEIISNILLNRKDDRISTLAIESVTEITKYLELNTILKTSSKNYSNSINLRKEERLLSICNEIGADHYVNASGGINLYEKSYFNKNGVYLSYIQNELSFYHQFGKQFVKGLSIIDVLMFNSSEEVRLLLNNYKLN